QETGRDGRDEKTAEPVQHCAQHSRIAASETTAADELSGCGPSQNGARIPPARNSVRNVITIDWIKGGV
ncbi:MAG: hypothetical protein AABY69_06755, partial [Nitrospirota bacterium]